MAAIASNGTGGGLSNATATWNGGVIPVEGDSVTIVLADVVTVTGTHVWGDDTVTAITVNGTLKASRAANSSLTVKGQLIITGATTATFDYGRFSTTDPIPAGITATLILNYSAAMANVKYGITINNLSNWYACGATRKVNTTLVGNVAATATTATVANATGWAIGDTVFFATSDGTENHFDSKVLTSVNTGTGAIGWATGVTYAHATACPVGNRTSNVTIKSFNTTNGSYVSHQLSSSGSDSRRECDYVSYEYCGSTSTASSLYFMNCTVSTPLSPWVTFSNNFFYNCNQGTATLFINQWNSAGFSISNNAFLSDVYANGHVYTASGTYMKGNDNVFYYNLATFMVSAFSQGGQGCEWTRHTYCSSNSVLMSQTNGAGTSFVSCTFHSAGAGSACASVQSGTCTFTSCKFGDSTLWGTPTTPYIFDSATTNAQVFDVTATDCFFGTPSISFYKNLSVSNPSSIARIANKGVDPLVQEVYTPIGNIVRDNTSKITGVQSLKMSPTSATVAITFKLYIPAPTGKKVGVSGYLWRDTANVTTVTLSGLGITSSVYTASGALSANEQFFVSGTQTTGTDGFLTLTFSTIGATGNVWIDSVSAPQASAIDFGEFGYWLNALPASIVSANTVSAGDVWNYLSVNATVQGSMGKLVKFIQTLLLIK